MEKLERKLISQDLVIRVEQLNKAALIRLEGELDANTAVEVENTLTRLLDSPLSNLLIDCHKLRYISSAGIGVLLSTLQACKERHVKLILFGLQPKITDVFTILGTEKIMTHADTREEALQHMVESPII